jgi:hypothetical protein
LLLSQRVGFALNAIDLLVGLQTLQLLIIAQLIELPLSLVGFRSGWGGLAAFRLIELALKLLTLAFTPHVFELFLALQLFYFFFPARLGLLFDNFLELVRGSPDAVRHHEDNGQDEC